MSADRIIIAGGGTGGHVFPALAIARALERLDPATELLFAGARGKMEMEKVPQAGYRIEGLDIAGMDRGRWWKNLSLPLKLWRSAQQAKKILQAFAPQAVVGVGGYASFPVLHQAQKAGIPTLIQEQNSFAGRSNRILGRKAKRICVAYPGMEKFFAAEKILLTGNPVRESILNYRGNPRQARGTFGLPDPEAKTLFVVGGSLGARSINEAVLAGLPGILQSGIQVIWQTGKLSYPRIRQAVPEQESRVWIGDFVEDMAAAYDAADLVVSRAGALTVAELCVAGKAVIFVPYPYAAEDHQTANARALVQQQAAILVEDLEASRELMPRILELMDNQAGREKLAANIRRWAIRDADVRIAEEIRKLA
jgi:UDP-N-acetylglucosamine--N-acetylmuramyl-(pentapeptide) pyrophosphoryl-undecaprenol N-acetylglucosamine transferase